GPTTRAYDVIWSGGKIERKLHELRPYRVRTRRAGADVAHPPILAVTEFARRAVGVTNFKNRRADACGSPRHIAECGRCSRCNRHPERRGGYVFEKWRAS